MKSSHKLAYGLIIIIGLWVLSGLIWESEPEKQAVLPASGTASVSAIKIEELAAQSRPQTVVAYGELQAQRRIGLVAETDGTVVEIVAKEGSRVKQGDVILRIDPRDRQARLAEMKAKLAFQQKQYEAGKRLAEKGYQSPVALAEQASELEEARSKLASMTLEMGRTDLRAPFGGLLDKINVKVGDYAGVRFGEVFSGGAGGSGSATPALATLIDNDPMRVVGQVSELDITGIEPGFPASVRLVSGETVQGKVAFVGVTGDVDTRTFRIEVEVPNADGALMDGKSADIMLTKGSVQAYLISPAVLSLDDKGTIGVKLAGDDQKVAFVPVKIIGDSPEGVWVVGLPERIRLITAGQAFLAAGQEVPQAAKPSPQPEEPEAKPQP